MARIEIYAPDTSIHPQDKVIGTDYNNNNATKNFSVGGLTSYISDTIGQLQFENNYVSSVALQGTELAFTGEGIGFEGNVSLSTLVDTYDLASSVQGANVGITLTDKNGNVDQVLLVAGSNITLAQNANNQITISSSGGGGGGSNDGYINNVNNTANPYILDFIGIGNAFNGSVNLPEEYISDVRLINTNLEFTAVGSAFAGIVDLSSLDTEYSLSAATQAGGARVSLNGTNGNVDSVDFLPGSGISMSLANNQLTIASTVTDTNYYVEDVVLNGTDLVFTAVGSAFGGTIDLSALDTNTTYDLFSFQAGNDVVIRLVGSDATSDSLRLSAGNNITLNDDGAGTITIDATGGGASYTFGTYLTETGGTVNHDATTRSDTASTATPSYTAAFTVIDSVTTNATGHVTGTNLKTVTLPAASDESCVFGNELSQSLTGYIQNVLVTWEYIQDNINAIGLNNANSVARNYHVTWTLSFTSQNGGHKAWDTKLVLLDAANTPITTLVEYNDSVPMTSDAVHTSTYSYSAGDIDPNYSIAVMIKGDSTITLTKATFSAVDSACFIPHHIPSIV